MTYDNKNPAYALNSYVWKLLESNLGWTTASYDGAVPIIPVQQQPELLQTANPFIVYGVARHPSEHLYALIKGAISYNIYATTVTEANKVAGLLANTFARQDEAAADVNAWLGTEFAGTGVNRGIAFSTIRTVMANNDDPAEEEAGYVSAMVMLEYKYIEINNSLQTTGFSYP